MYSTYNLPIFTLLEKFGADYFGLKYKIIYALIYLKIRLNLRV